jgi:hydrogenase maturation protease
VEPLVLVACFGNPHRGDDGFGPAVAEALRREAGIGVDVAVLRADALALLDAWRGYAHVVVVDAVASPLEPGTLVHVDVSRVPVPESLAASSTHALGPAGAIELARALGELPATVEILAASAQAFEPGAPLSPPVAAAVAATVERIRALGRTETD